MVIIGTAVAVSLSLLAVVAGLLYDQLYVPSRTVASVNTATLTRRDYWQERRQALAREVVQAFQLDALLAGQNFGQDFTARVPTTNQQVRDIRTQPVDEATLGEWQTRTLIEQGAQELGATTTDVEVDQQLVGDLAAAFIPDQSQAAGPQPTVVFTATATAAAVETAAAAAPTSATATTGTVAATPTTGPTATIAPTPTARPTFTADEAAPKVAQIVDAVFEKYTAAITQATGQVNLIKEDFTAALRNQYRQQVLTTRVQERLVAEQGFQPSDTPAEVNARQVLLKIPDDTPEDKKEAAFAEAKARADAVYAELAGGADFATVARERSDDAASKDQGGDLGFFGTSSSFDPAFVAAAFALKDGEISQPVRTQSGWHVIQPLERRADPLDKQLRDARSKAFETWLSDRRGAATLVPVPTATPEPSAAPDAAPAPAAEPTGEALPLTTPTP